ncbi:thioredoxin [Paenibacillus apiarius]|uniref:Thioredoxin n=1 Tax=Paenibacillus apiarius TaxID=46240 RepID=A0ABT4DS85_9BACL|nr:thioredoxin [Paenibacillus apiarius]MCY9517080.1 thioredoxin [Paenibacillus apiarius]MCY9520223.1 thioredoxin [Paenibacillus apiarius]MCY9554889.1 thioredoxin [Paenibacillus apiarius]MCY9561400.1 thioredoxin [Paenibacillus apiarius]MCY9685922.1 thioredoxin [Paenibacillus apiarius]
MTTVELTDSTIEAFIQDKKLVLIDFWAPWCGPCRMLAPTLDRLAEELGDRAIIAKVNVDSNPYAAIKYQVQGIPNLKLFYEGKEVGGFVGGQPLETLKSAVMTYAR